MGQATSSNLPAKGQAVLCDYDEFASNSRFSKATFSTLAVPMIIVAFPILNAYTFVTEQELTGVKLMDGAIGGLLGVLGCK